MAKTTAHPHVPTLAAGVTAVSALLALMPVTGHAAARTAPPVSRTASTRTWRVTTNGSHLQIAYGRGRNFPQYADLDTTSGYLRMINSTAAGWGTSVILLPALWSRASCPTDYCQGAPVRASSHTLGTRLMLSVHGTIATLKVAVTITLTPPADSTLTAKVTTKVTGTARLDSNRPGEAFKPVMLSSMHDSATIWDTRRAFTGTHPHPLPAAGWIIHPPVRSRDFGLQGGTSTWKKNAPTIEVTLDRSRPVTGWVTADTNPNHDNVGLWCAASKVLASWSYTLTAETGRQL